MTKPAKLLALAASLPSTLPTCGTVTVFGHHVVRPGDILYALSGSGYADGVLRIVLRGGLPEKEEHIEVIAPSHVQLSVEALRIEEATRVRAFGSDWTREAATEAALVLEP